MPANDGLSAEQRGLANKSLVLHSCNNGIPKGVTLCPFCHRVNASSEESLDLLVKARETELKDELKRLKAMKPKKADA